MIPSTFSLLEQDFEIEEQPSKTYRLDFSAVRNFTDNLDSMKQVIYKILNTERYQYIIYSWNYGVELVDLFGEPLTYVIPEIERRITESLLQDSRIESVDSFSFDTSKKGVVHATFTVHTVFGDIEAERGVNI